mgnify:CR=1 FL=1
MVGGPPKPPRPPAVETEPKISSVEKAAPIESSEKISPRLLQGSFYLTKIARALAPQYIPDIEEAAEGESVFKREGVVYHVSENDGDDVENKAETAETGNEVEAISDKLEKLGLTLRVDARYQSYAGEGKGNVRYIKTLAPWEVADSAPGQLDLLFDADSLRASIRGAKNLSPEIRKECKAYLDRILELFEEEKVEQEKKRRENLRDCTRELKKMEEMLSVSEMPGRLDKLFAITTEAEAVQRETRNAAIRLRNAIDKHLKILKAETNVTQEQYDAFYARYKKLQLAIGARNGGVIDHTR